jgi:hypothetical protein
MAKKKISANTSVKLSEAYKSISPSTWVKLLVVIQLLMLAWQFSPSLCTNGDNARYLTLGKSLVEGKGYRNIQEPGAPVESQYPVLFPVLLGAAQLFSDSFVLPKILISIIGSLVVLLCFLLYRKYPWHILLPLMILTALSGLIAEYSTILMSEVPYLFFSLLALFLRERSLARPESKALFWAAIVFSVAPINCRSIGLAFSAAWIVSNIWSKDYRYAIMHAVLLALTVSLFRSFVPSDPYLVQLFQRSSYEPEAGFVTALEMCGRIADNIRKYSGFLVRNSLAPFARDFPSFVNSMLSRLCVGAIFTGWLRSFFIPGQRFAGIYLVFYFGILCMWQPQWSGDRFLVSIVPFLYLMLLSGVESLVSFFDISGMSRPAGFFNKLASGNFIPPARRTLRTIWIAVGIIVLFNLDYGIANSANHKNPPPDWRNFYSCADWVRIHTSSEAVVMSRKPELFYIRSRRCGTVYPYTHDVEKVIKSMETAGVTHVVHDNFSWTRTTAKYLYPAISAHPERFKLVYALKDPDTFIMEFLPE